MMITKRDTKMAKKGYYRPVATNQRGIMVYKLTDELLVPCPFCGLLMKKSKLDYFCLECGFHD
jgi:hypothetical protein